MLSIILITRETNDCGVAKILSFTSTKITYFGAPKKIARTSKSMPIGQSTQLGHILKSVGAKSNYFKRFRTKRFSLKMLHNSVKFIFNCFSVLFIELHSQRTLAALYIDSRLAGWLIGQSFMVKQSRHFEYKI